MEKKRNCWVIPTDKPSRLFIDDGILELDSEAIISEDSWIINQNIYITNDEEIKERDLIINLDTNRISKADFKKDILKNYIAKHFKKIILTTDQDLIKDGIQAIPDEFLEWFVKNPNCEEVEADYRYDTNLQPILDSFGNKVLRIKIPTESENLSQIIIPKEEAKKKAMYSV
jgi:hypothetical protein